MEFKSIFPWQLYLSMGTEVIPLSSALNGAVCLPHFGNNSFQSDLGIKQSAKQPFDSYQAFNPVCWDRPQGKICLLALYYELALPCDPIDWSIKLVYSKLYFWSSGRQLWNPTSLLVKPEMTRDLWLCNCTMLWYLPMSSAHCGTDEIQPFL